MTRVKPPVAASRALAAALALVMTVAPGAQTRVDPPKNKYSPADDVKLGQQAAEEATKELPLLRDDFVSSYVTGLGERLERAIPQRFQYPEFRYSFTTVNAKEINAFALPGGPMFVNRGMIEAATTEGEVVGVMAHELSHVLLRHGTAQATKASNFQLGAIAGAIAGAIIGGNAGAIISEGSRFGLGAYFLKYSREYEKQADILGAQLMAEAGYDPQGLATMFETISKQGSRGGPEWMSSHPNPGNRSTYIRQEAARLRIRNPQGDSDQFSRVKARLQQMAPAPTPAEGSRNPTSGGGATGTVSGTVDPPSSQFRTVRGGDIFEAAVPANWREYTSTNVVKYAPEGGYGRLGQQTVFTHGVEFGIVRNGTRDLRAATNNLLNTFAQGNPRLRTEGNQQQWRLSGRQAITTILSNESDATRSVESITVTTALLNDATLFYCLTVAPENVADQYGTTFNRVLRSLNLKR